jgi:hypothetical protein
MDFTEETIEATLDSQGQLQPTHQPRLPPGPVSVTIRIATPVARQRGLADVIQEIADEQRARGFSGRSAEELCAAENDRVGEDVERDEELDAARSGTVPGGEELP